MDFCVCLQAHAYPVYRKTGHCANCNKPRLGPTGESPRPKISPDDKGQLKLAIAADKEKQVVRIAFGAYVNWVALPAKEAQEFAELILEKVKEL